MKSILKATAMLGSVSLVSMVFGLLSAKIYAVWLGPQWLGYMGLLQSLVGIATLVASMGVTGGVVRAGAQALAQNEVRRMAALRRGAWLLCWTLGGLAVLCLVVLRVPVSRVMLGGAEHAGAVVLMSLALLLTLAAGLQLCLLNAHQRLGDLARIGLLNTVCGVGLSLLLIWRWREGGIVWAMIAGAGVNCAFSLYYLRTRLPPERVRLARAEVLDAARVLLRFGAPYTASMMVGAGVLMLVPVFVLHALGQDDVGFYRAASAVSITYLGFLLNTMAQDYYPRVSAASAQPLELSRLVNEQLRLVLLLAGPIILGMLALVPFLVPLIYSERFIPTVDLLEWQLIGDLFKFSSWTMSFVILARNGSSTFFMTELFGGTLLLTFSWLGMRWFGLAGLGIGFVLTSAAYCLLCWAILRRSVSLRLTTQNKLLFLTLFVMMLFVRALPYAGLGSLRTPLALALAALTGLGSLYVIWGEVGGWKNLVAWGRTRLRAGGA